MRLVRSALFALAFYAGTILYVLVGVAALPLGARAVQAVANGWARFHRACAILLLGVRTRVEGEVPRGAVLVAAKHQSMYETLELVALLDTPSIVMKRELARIPLWGRLTRAYGMIAIDRSGGAAALRQLMKRGESARAEGRPVVIFPEGTRVAPGETPRLQPGFAGLYRALGLPVVPLALDSGRVWPRRSFVKRAGTVTFRFGEPIPPGLRREEVEARVHAAINALERRSS
ncbi:MAG: 1-acyl-sn-glycerol-3-phosphate acyltransferase [Alphaproteobacteria bacterium]|nr:1-acyl-sn-glycerol-3-phosphate acyltransferase [Alphaproteobacteria bacterium]MBV9370703.1 1-acyl-sn-glycerol-3-phosphate acyltransferase [Alphaproteobacteria bacterium]MBV9899884.1 1-acyl-sn-glycerol-3-phosphate acyltransferase [Alphaproteobacteria bacterium]